MKFQGKNFFLEYAEHSEEWTKATLTREEFEDFRENEKKLKKITIENETKDLKILELESSINKIKKEFNEQLLLKLELEKKIILLENQNKILTSQNENLLRMNRERSNAERKLYPKKLHNGYVLLHQESYNKNYNFKVKGDYRGSYKTFNYNLELSKYRLETPYLCNLELNFIKNLILDDIKKYYDLDYLNEIPKNTEFFNKIKILNFFFNLKIINSNKYYLIEFNTNKNLSF